MTNPVSSHLARLDRLKFPLSNLEIPKKQSEYFHIGSNAIIDMVSAIEQVCAKENEEQTSKCWFLFRKPADQVQKDFYEALQHSMIVSKPYFSQSSREEVEEWNATIHGIVGEMLFILRKEDNHTAPNVFRIDMLLKVLQGVQGYIDDAGGLYDWEAAQRALIAEAKKELSLAISAIEIRSEGVSDVETSGGSETKLSEMTANQDPRIEDFLQKASTLKTLIDDFQISLLIRGLETLQVGPPQSLASILLCDGLSLTREFVGPCTEEQSREAISTKDGRESTRNSLVT